MWERDLALPDVIANAWAKNRPAGSLGLVATSLKEVMKELKQWCNANFGNVLKEIEKLHTVGVGRPRTDPYQDEPTRRDAVQRGDVVASTITYFMVEGG